MKLQRQFHFQIEAIKKEINDISKRKDVYKFSEGAQSSMAKEEDEFLSSSVSTLLIEEKDTVDLMKEHVRRLEDLILREKDEQLKVISIVGMGGLGKTTLARKIYRAVKTKFQCHAWVSVTRSFEAKAILRCMLQEFCESKLLPNGVDKMSEDSLRQQISNCLQGQSYVLVLDDIWDSKAWEVVRPALPRNTGGKVIFTTCDETVASPLHDGFQMYKLDFLPYQVARDLFCSIAFKEQNPQGQSPSWLDVFVDDMVRKCEGLPLALVTLGGFMSSSDTNPSRWIRVLDTLSYQLDINPKLKEIKSIFLRRYNHLPPHLKCCLLYCAMFPVGSEIPRDELIRLWVAEGFVIGERQMTLEEVANTYFNELIKCNILQGLFKEENWEIQYCRMHELIHDATVHMLEKEQLGGVIARAEDSASQANRWLAFHGEQLQGRPNLNDWNIRSLHMFVKQRRIPIIDVLFGISLRLLRVLNLRDMEISSLPKDFGDLIHLRYLALGKLLFSSLPSSLGKLYNLQTLYLGQDHPMPLPKEITSARPLRHLLSKTPLSMPSGVGNLSHLQTLDCVEFKDVNVLKELEKLTQIRKLNIHNVIGSEDYGEELSSCIAKMKRLHELKIVCGLKERLKLSSSLSSTPPLLDTMHIDGTMDRLPGWIASLSCLRVMSLSYCKLQEDPLKFLSQLHSLVKLILCDASSARKMEFGNNGQTFSSLEYLELSEMYTLEELGGYRRVS
ncbi:hypothetical protein Sjap_020536 [Stephania japonica]|uniref:NB-ARC domain-containing protein n=1 Tax=Stephania japonica TaxID=461633 RepID=A0AAP0F3M7_9MAGN